MTPFEAIEDEMVKFFNQRGMGKLTATQFLKHFAEDPHSYLTVLHAFRTAVETNKAVELIERHQLNSLSLDFMKEIRDQLNTTISKIEATN